MLNVKNAVESICSKTLFSQRDIFVLKGINLFEITGVSVDLKEVIENKITYLNNLIKNNRKYISYDEFLALEVFIAEQFDNVYIIDNNIYSSFYPLSVLLPSDLAHRLIAHFDNDNETDNNENIGDISKYVEVYANFIQKNETKFVVYNSRGTQLNTYVLPLWENKPLLLNEIAHTADTPFFTIYNEEDYLGLLIDLLAMQRRYFIVKIENEFIARDLYRSKLGLFAAISNIQIELLSPSYKPLAPSSVRPEFYEILQKYWSYDTFRSIQCYDLNKIDNNSIELVNISQDEIISVIIDQCVKCISQHTFKDVFVTAPTGAGKSVLFQIPAIYLADKHSLLTIVISPLIGLMNDQVNSLHIKNYKSAQTINSDISPILKQEIIDKVKNGECNILYISPETLLARSDIEMLIGERKIGLLVVDEAHIVTTWGKQFRPDYWFLGDHVTKLRKTQKQRKGHSFVVATFTATSIYGGIENMYQDTKDSLNLYSPITYLGMVKRDNIQVVFDKSEKITGRDEYELRKFEQIAAQIDNALIENKRTLVYFPTVQLIIRFYDYCQTTDFAKYVTVYHGQMDKYKKNENYNDYSTKKKPIMLATKAFGMGIDIDDIELVIHFAPTGNVCDYIQEIGRAARKKSLTGIAYYNFMSNDFKHINRLHGLSAIRQYQLVEVIRKILELFKEQNKANLSSIHYSRRRNELLVDASSFAHIFENDFSDENNAINKVKTAMLIIQKDFENRQGFSPFFMRPIPLFSVGYFQIPKDIQVKLNNRFGRVIVLSDVKNMICTVNLKNIWERSCSKSISFAKFKFLLYSQSQDLDNDLSSNLTPAMAIDVFPSDSFEIDYNKIIKLLEDMFLYFIQESKYVSTDDIRNHLVVNNYLNAARAESIANILIASVKVFSRDFHNTHAGKIYSLKPLLSGEEKYLFSSGIENYLKWIKKSKENIFNNLINNSVFVLNSPQDTKCKEYHIVLGILESFDLLTFKSLGGDNSQLSIYVNSTKTMRQIVEKPKDYENVFLEKINLKHDISVEMLTYLYSNINNSSDFWDNIESYFLGHIPDIVKQNYEIKHGIPLPTA